MTQDSEKQAAARRALDFVEDGMVLGLGTGSTADHFVRFLGERVAQGLRIRGIPTSTATGRLARSLGIEVISLDDVPAIDVTVDGADEVDRNMQLIKGGGGALLREKIVAAASRTMIVIADSSKLVDRLGGFALPVEIVPFGASQTITRITNDLKAVGIGGVTPLLRKTPTGSPFITDEGNWIADCPCKEIADPAALASRLSETAGVVDHGLFIDMAAKVVVGTATGTNILERAA